MQTLKTPDGVERIETFMKSAGGSPAEWYVGISHHAGNRLKQHGMLGKPYANSWEFESEEAAAEAEKYLLDSGLRPAPAEQTRGEPRTQLYVFRAPKMASFREFLDRTQKQQDPENKRTERRREWVAAVERLIEQLVAWVKEIDSAGLLIVDPFRLRQTEMGLGAYEVQAFTIRLDDTIIQIRPVARFVVGTVKLPDGKERKAQGRVDVTDGVRRYTLYRTLGEEGERWYIVDEASNTAELDQNQFLAVLEDLLS